MIEAPEIYFKQRWLIFGYGLSIPGKVFLKLSLEDSAPEYKTLFNEISHEIDWQTGYTVKQYLKDLLKYGYYNHPAEVRARRFADYHSARFLKSGLTWQKYLKFTLDEINRFANI